LTKAIFISVS